LDHRPVVSAQRNISLSGFVPFILRAVLACAFLVLASAGFGQTLVLTNSNLAVTISGKAVFGLAVSPGPPVGAMAATGLDGLDELRSGGILFYRIPVAPTWKASSNTLNSAMITTNQAALDWCAAHGMLCLFALNDLSSFTSSDTNTPALLKNLMGMFQNHPALGMWKNKDEAWWAGASEPDLQRGYDIIRAQDPNHLVEQTHAPRGTVSDLQPYNNAASVLMVDDYPVVVPLGSASNPPITNTQVSQFGDWTKQLSQVANNSRNFWMVEQIAFSGTVPPSHVLVFPTFQQERFMAYQAIVNGARGLMFFGGNVAATLTNSLDSQLGWNWSFWTNTLKPLTLQLATNSPLHDALVAAEAPGFVSMSGASYPDIEYCVRESGTNLYLLATKREGATVNVTFSGLPAWATSGSVLFESNRSVSVSSGEFTDSFAQWDVHVYKFSYTDSAPVFDCVPASRTNVTNSVSTFVASALGRGTLTYRWRKDGVALSDSANVAGSATARLTVSNLALSDSGNYDVVVIGNGSITSAPPAVLTVVADVPPTIVTQPKGQTNYLGNLANFTVAASNATGASYQWRFNGTNISDDARVIGSTTSSLTVSPLNVADNGYYSVMVANAAGSVTSSDATLSVVVPPSTPNWITMWTCAPNVNAWATANGGANTPNERTLAFNSLSNQLYVVQRTGANPTVYVLNATNGTFLYKLNTNGVNFTGYSGNIPLCGIAVANDGAIYACNNDTAGTGVPTLKMYRWANSAPTTQPQLIYFGDPLSGTNSRWGDALDVRGSGTGTVLITDNHQPNTTNPSLNPYIFVLTPLDSALSSFTGKVFLQDTLNNPSFNSSSIGHSLQFDSTGTNYWQKHYGQALAKNYYNPNGANCSASPFVTNYSNWPTNIGPVAYLAQSNYVAAIRFSGTTGLSPDTLELYSVANFNNPTLLCAANFPANQTANANRIGQVIMTPNYVFAIDANNGLLAFRLTGPTAPSFLSQPQSQFVLTNADVTFSAVAQGTDDLFYQWRRNGAPIAGATTNSFSIDSVQTTDSGTYTLVVTNAYGSSTATAVLQVTIPPTITAQPTNQAVNFGDAFSFSVSANGTPAPAYQWYHNDTEISGATNATFTKGNAQVADSGSYYVVITNIADEITSFEVTLTLAPQILAPPQSVTVLQGNNAAFSVTAQGSAPMSYQWTLNGTAIAGATSSSYIVTNAQATDGGGYAVVISNGAGPLTSATAMLSVLDSPTRLLNIGLTNQVATMLWKTDVGVNFTLQYKTNLSDAQWTSLSNVTASASTLLISDATSTNTQRFYQLYSAARASEVAGFLEIPLIGNSDSYVSHAFVRPAIAVTLVGSVSSNTIAVSDAPNWTPNQFAQSNSYYARFVSGPSEGRIYPIISNGANSVTVNSVGALTNVQPNDVISIEPYWTLGTTWPNGDGVFASPTPGNRYTEVLLPSTNNGVNLSAAAVMYFNGGVWKQIGFGNASQNDVVLPLNSYFVVRHNVATNSTMVQAGVVVSSKMAVPLRTTTSSPQDNFVSVARPVRVTLDQSGLIGSGAFSASPLPGSRTDELLYFDNSVASRNKSATAVYYYWNGAWRQVGVGTNDVGSTAVFGSGTAAIIRKASNNVPSVIWTNAPNW
jgi:uncharacterized protein (TIGR02597 family)